MSGAFHFMLFLYLFRRSVGICVYSHSVASPLSSPPAGQSPFASPFSAPSAPARAFLNRTPLISVGGRLQPLFFFNALPACLLLHFADPLLSNYEYLFSSLVSIFSSVPVPPPLQFRFGFRFSIEFARQ